MAVESGNVERLAQWLAEGSPARSAHAAAEALAEKLAVVVFNGDGAWPERTDRVEAYRDGLRAWFARDGARESQFVQLTGPDADPGVLIDWFLPVIAEWESVAVPTGAGDIENGTQAGTRARGLRNPNHDGTPGTEYYHLEEATGEYLYAASEDSAQWESYEQRRYSKPARHDDYGLTCRYDLKDEVYEWYDEATRSWNDQAWADQHVAGGKEKATTNPQGGPEPAWDENWKMFYRIGQGGVYEFAHAITPGEPSSGCGEVWQLIEQPGAITPAPDVVQLKAEIRASVNSVLEERKDLREALSDDEIEAIIDDMTRQAISGRKEG